MEVVSIVKWWTLAFSDPLRCEKNYLGLFTKCGITLKLIWEHAFASQCLLQTTHGGFSSLFCKMNASPTRVTAVT